MIEKNKNKITIASLIVFVLASLFVAIIHFVPKPMIHVDYPYYSDVKSITEASDVIIVGEVISAGDVQYLMDGG